MLCNLVTVHLSRMAIRFDPVGQCIYCGAKDVPLGREHIIPLALNGDRILPEASCPNCSKVTSKIERYVTKTMFGAFRAKTNMQTRRPKKRPTDYPISIKKEGVPELVVKVPTAEHPHTLLLPRIPPARYLGGLPDEPDKPVDCVWWVYSDNSKFEDAAEKFGITDGQLSAGLCDPSKLSQMLAKIGHCAAVAEFGFNSFRPLALDLALGRSESINYLVGCRVKPDPKPQSDDDLHDVRCYVRKHDNVIVAEIGLFINLGAPRYHVVVGLKMNGL